MRKKRLTIIAFFLTFLFSLLILRFYHIQIIEGEKWEHQAKIQHQFFIIEPFKRGSFYSNTSIKRGHPEIPTALVLDVSHFHLFINPKGILTPFRDEMAEKLCQMLLLDKKKIKQQFDKPSRSRKLASWLSADQKSYVEKWWLAYAKEKKLPRNSLFFIEDYKRSHPYGKLLGQVLHTVREERDLKTKQGLPTGGLEWGFNTYLQGKDGKRLLLRSPRFSLEKDQTISMPENGADVYLTVNHVLQAIAEEEIEKGVKKAGAKSGYAVMMNPFTGEILALAQYPFFNPEEYAKFFNDPELIEHTKVKAITDCNEPGSVFKPITAALALIANEELKKQGKKPLFSPQEIIPTDQGNFPGRSKPIRDTRFHKKLNMYMGIQKSSNIYVARLAHRIIDIMGDEWYSNKLENLFGIGKKTGIELPSESPGFLPKPGKKYSNGSLQWSIPTPFSLAMGYNLLTTGLQIARAYGIFANGGFDVKPTLLKKISKKRDDGTEEILYAYHTKESKRILSQEICEEITKTLVYSTKPGGCGMLAQISGYTEGGKSGTTEKIIHGTYSPKIHFSSFVGFAPVKMPRFVLFVGIDEPEYRFIPGIGRSHYGGRCAAPVFKAIGTRALEFLGITPDDPYGYPLGDPRSDPLKEYGGKEAKALKLLYEELN